MLRFMKNKILIPLLVIGALAAFFSFKYSGGDGQSSEERKALIMETVMKVIKEGHFSPREINDSFSYKVFNATLEGLDNEKKFFTQKDIDALSKYKFEIDDQIQANSITFYEAVNTIYVQRLESAEKYYDEAIKTSYTFTGDGEINLNGERIAYAADEAALKARWNDYIKFRTLAKYVDLKNEQGKTADSAMKKKTDAELEADARASIKKNYDRYFKNLKKQKESDRFAAFINDITQNEDPHTEYFPPKEKKRFDEMMSGTFFGIGAVLREDGDKTKIASIVTGSPCWKQGELKAGDEIQKVAQGDKEPVDVTGYELEDVVQLIRGKKGTEVRLTVKQMNGAIKVIPIIRDEVKIEEVFAKSVIIKGKNGPVGYIYLPEFYSDFQHINGRRCAEDVAIEVQKLKAAKVAGIILDLRNNGGGSLSDVVDMAGLFIGSGPVVQVKTNDAPAMTLSANNRSALYDGPMAVMINEGSASASEIMAAVLQDYSRAVVVGSTSFGKGTVQKLAPLDEFVDPATRLRMLGSRESDDVINLDGKDRSLGSLKITIQKFYRVNGGSTQLKGVTPDISLPDPYELAEIGERHDKAALSWDEIPAANYKLMNSVNVKEIAMMSKSRVAANPTFGLIQQSAKQFQKQREDNVYSLNEVKYRKQLEEANATSKKLEELQKKITTLEFKNLPEDMARINADSSSVAKNNEWIKNLKKDIYIAETVNIINDMLRAGMKSSVASGKN